MNPWYPWQDQWQHSAYMPVFPGSFNKSLVTWCSYTMQVVSSQLCGCTYAC
jgi:hypothetical protein